MLTTPDREQGQGDHRFPEFLPGGEAVLFTITSVTGRPDDAQIAVLDLRTGTYKTLLRGSHAYYVPTGHLVYGFAGTLRAAPFALPSLEVEGASAPVREGVTTTFLGAVDAVVAANGSLAYVPGGAGTGGRQTVVSVDREGRPSLLPGIALDSYRDVRVSPDGKRLALATQDEIWIYDFERESLSRLTGDSASETSPLWTRDAERIVFTSNRAGYPELFSRRADGTGSDEPFLTRAKDLRDLRANGWSEDGARLLFTEVDTGPAAVGEIAIGDTSAARMLWNNDFTTTTRLCRQTDAGSPTSPTTRGRPRFTSSGIRSSEADSQSRRTAAGSRCGRLGMVGNCSSAAWTVGRYGLLRCSLVPGSSPGVRACCSSSRCCRYRRGAGRTTSPGTDSS